MNGLGWLGNAESCRTEVRHKPVVHLQAQPRRVVVSKRGHVLFASSWAAKSVGFVSGNAAIDRLPAMAFGAAAIAGSRWAKNSCS